MSEERLITIADLAVEKARNAKPKSKPSAAPRPDPETETQPEPEPGSKPELALQAEAEAQPQLEPEPQPVLESMREEKPTPPAQPAPVLTPEPLINPFHVPVSVVDAVGPYGQSGPIGHPFWSPIETCPAPT